MRTQRAQDALSVNMSFYYMPFYCLQTCHLTARQRCTADARASALMRPYATSVCGLKLLGLKLLVYEALSCTADARASVLMRPYATSVCGLKLLGLKLLVYEALSCTADARASSLPRESLN
jgi:hypothetical protein